MPLSYRCASSLFLLFIFFSLLTTFRASAQALPTEFRTMDLSVFGGYEYVQPDYGRPNNTGGGFGVNVTRYLRLPVQPSLEVRANIGNGTVVEEHTYLFGFRALADYRRVLHPYADFLVGPGTIHYVGAPVGALQGDNSTVYSYGGGIDVDVYRHFAVKGDFQFQHWKTGQNVTFAPTVTLIGVSYRIPFRPHISQDTASRH